MWKLIKLELQKHNLRWYITGTAIASVLIALFIFGISVMEDIDGITAFEGVEDMFIVSGSFVRATFIICAAVLISKLVIDEYKNKTITVLFMYPIKRQKLMAAKLIIVFGLTVIAMFLSNLFVNAVLLAINSFAPFVTLDEPIDYIQQLISIAAFSVAAAGTSLISLYFGMRKHSVPATIISSIIIASLISGHNPAFSIASIIYIPAALAIVGIAIAWRSVKNIELADLN